MDPITAVFISYIELAGQYTAKHIFIDPIGLDVTAITVEHQGMEVPFSYQLWRIRDNSVCFTYKQNAAQYSKCTVAASSLFQAMCKQMQTPQITNTKHRSIKNMYCNAALSYEATVANVQWTEVRSDLDVARRECNTAMAGALGSTDEVLIQDRNELCGKYKELKKELRDKK